MGEAVLEAIVSGLGLAIYGTPERPHPAVLRNLCRIIAFAGVPIALVALTTPFHPPFALALGWGLAFTIVFCAEWELGSRKLAWAGAGSIVLLLSVAIGAMV